MSVQKDGVVALIERPELERASLLARGAMSTLTLFLMTAVYGGWKNHQ
jgi:hypothetical protein